MPIGRRCSSVEQRNSNRKADEGIQQSSEAFQSVHHDVLILCYNVLSDFFTFAAASVGTEQMSCTLVFSLNKVYKHWRDITQGKFTCDKSNVFKGLQRIYYKI